MRFQKIMFRILFVIIAAAVITFSAIFLGHYLQIKVAEAEAVQNTSEPASAQITSRPKMSDNASSTREVNATGLELRGYHTEDSVVAAINNLAEHYDSLLVDLTGSGGDLLYTSPALCNMLRIATPEEDNALTVVRSAISAAKSKNMYLCAVMDTSFGVLGRGQDEQVDGTLFAELASFGVDEILIKGVILDTENIPADEIASYLAGCAEITGDSCTLGVLFPDDVFLNFSNARSIQTIASAADFTGIDMTSYSVTTPDEIYSKTAEDVASLYGSFSIYNMRVVLSTADHDLLAAQVQALRDSNISSICFTESILPSSLNYKSHASDVDEAVEDDVDTVKNDSSERVVSQTNPYATVSESSDDNLRAEKEVRSDEEDSVGENRYVDENGSVLPPR